MTKLARTMDKHELAAALGVDERVVRKWASDRTIPEEFWIRDGDRSYRYAPLALVLGQLICELGQLFGVTSPLPKRIATAVAPQLAQVWAEPEIPAKLRVNIDGCEIQIAPLTFAATARTKLEELPA